VDRNDEPVLDQDSAEDLPDAGDGASADLPDRIRRLVTGQPYGVLCTHGDRHAYGSLVAFAFSEDLRTAVFATPKATRKYRLLADHHRVALVVDDRPQNLDRMMEVEAVTATGKAAEISAGPDYDREAGLLLSRHPQLRSFIAAESTALFRIDILRFLHVVRFQEVRQWIPGER
jgi:nitroimidazol reductase NimA-like FMN-containing flavoprotein (pyridoxamine 5'-phosphate oxidase superfamily)